MSDKINNALDLKFYSFDQIRYINNEAVNMDFKIIFIKKNSKSFIGGTKTYKTFTPVIFYSYQCFINYKKKYYKYPINFINNYVSLLLLIGHISKTNETPPFIDNLQKDEDFNFVKKLTYGSETDVEYKIFLNSISEKIIETIGLNENLIINIIGSSGTGKSTLVKNIIIQFCLIVKNFKYTILCFEEYDKTNKSVFESHEFGVDFSLENSIEIFNLNGDIINQLNNVDEYVENVFTNNLIDGFPREHVCETKENKTSSRSILYFIIYYLDQKDITRSIFIVDNVGFESLIKITNEQLYLREKHGEDPLEIIKNLNITQEEKEINISGYNGYKIALENFKSLRDNTIKLKYNINKNIQKINILALPIESEKYKLRDYITYKRLFWKIPKSNLFFYL